MKKIAIIGIVALVVIGCVLAAGCTSTSTTPASTTSTTGTDAVVGTWTLPNGTTVVFGEDFKGVMTQDDNKINFTWKKTTDGTYQVDNEKGEQVIWTMDSSKNSMTNAAKMVLTKKASSASGASLSYPISRDLSETEMAAEASLASGTINDSIGDSDAGVIVTTEKELRSAVDNGGKVTLGANITIDDQLEIKKEVILDLNGYDLKSEGDDRVIKVCSTGNLTLNDTDQSYGPGRIKDGEEDGAGVYVDKGGIFTMNAGLITDNDGDDNGAGVYVNGGTFIMNGGSIKGNTADDYGGGVYITNGGTFIMNDGTITKNLTDWHDGGGVYLCEGCEFTMNGGNISSNTADNDGGGVFVAGTFTMNYGNIQSNKADDGNGGGVFVTGSGLFTMKGGNVSLNRCDENGGGVYVKGIFRISNGTVSANLAGNNGGGVYVKGIFTMSGSATICHNSVNYSAIEDNNGGGVYVEEDGMFTMRDGSIHNNEAVWGGGVYLAPDSQLSMKNGRIYENYAEGSFTNPGRGGGVYASKYAVFSMVGGEIVYNVAELGGGVYAYVETDLTDGYIEYNIGSSRYDYENDLFIEGEDDY